MKRHSTGANQISSFSVRRQNGPRLRIKPFDFNVSGRALVRSIDTKINCRFHAPSLYFRLSLVKIIHFETIPETLNDFNSSLFAEHIEEYYIRFVRLPKISKRFDEKKRQVFGNVLNHDRSYFL